MNHYQSESKTIAINNGKKKTQVNISAHIMCTCLFPHFIKIWRRCKNLRELELRYQDGKVVFTCPKPRIIHNSATIPSGNIYDLIPTSVIWRNKKGQEKHGRNRDEGIRRVNRSGFLQRQQQPCLSIFHWLRWSLEEQANSSCDSHIGAPCVASLPPLMNSTTVVVGL